MLKGYIDSRQTFINTFLCEMPMGTPATALNQQIVHDIREKQKYFKTEKVSNNLFKMEGSQLVYYWYEVDSKILLGAEFLREHHALVVNYIGKTNKGSPPYASDLYLAVLADRKNLPTNPIGPSEINAIVMSDSKLSEEGLNIWIKLLNAGHKLLIYNKDYPGAVNIPIDSIDHLKQYFKHNDVNYQKYRYVLAENGPSFGDILGFFSLRRIRELTPGML